MLVLLAVVLDRLLGEPNRWHPLVGFGCYAQGLDKALNHPEHQFIKGTGAWFLTVLPFCLLAFFLDRLPHAGLLDILVLYWAIAYRSLQEHIEAIYQPLINGDLKAARQNLSYIVSRDTGEADELAVRRGAIESALENGSDAVFAPIFWWLVAGIPGVMLYRLANTLDAMWGYRTPRYKQFGCFAARVDDVLNFIPARLVALSYAVLGNVKQGLKCWREQASSCASPNAGVVMCAGAGALSVTLGGRNCYHGEWIEKPLMGAGTEPSNNDVVAAQSLLRHTLVLWCSVAFVLSWLIA